MVIDKTDLATQSISIYREKIRPQHGFFDPLDSHHGCLDPMRSLEEYHLIGACIDGTHKQLFPTYTLYYDYTSMEKRGDRLILKYDCPILKCDYYIK